MATPITNMSIWRAWSKRLLLPNVRPVTDSVGHIVEASDHHLETAVDFRADDETTRLHDSRAALGVSLSTDGQTAT